jgi:NDP-sugar pyrophosphorylase family protein
VRALILSAGLGTRLRPLTYVRAKAAIPVNGEPLVRRIAARLAAQGFTDLVVNLHHKPSSITRLLGDGADLGVRLRYSWEQRVLGSAGGPRHALPLLVDGDDDPRARFLMVNGDTLTDLDARSLVAAHDRAGDAAVTMALIRNPRPDKYGGVAIDGDRVTGFTRAATVARSYHFIGLQVAEARAFASLPDGRPMESVNDVYPQLLARDPRAICAHVVDATFQDIGTPADYLRTCLELAAAEGNRLLSGERVVLDASAALTDSAVWDDVVVEPGARLDASIVCDGARVPRGAHYARCAILPAEGHAPAAGERIEGALLISPI